MMNSNYLVYGIIGLLAIVIIVSIIKKAIKLAIFIIIILLGFSAYNIFVKGISPIEEMQGYRTNIEYGKSISGLTGKVKVSVDNIKNIVEAKKLDEGSINTIKTENANLHKYENEALVLKHTEKLNTFHEKYCGYLKTIVNNVEGIERLSNLEDSKNIGSIIENLNSGFNALWDLKIK